MGFESAPADGAFYAYIRVEGDDMELAGTWLKEPAGRRDPRNCLQYARVGTVIVRHIDGPAGKSGRTYQGSNILLKSSFFYTSDPSMEGQRGYKCEKGLSKGQTG